MPIEIEAKMKVASLEPTRDKLKALGATPAGEHLELNTFFDTDDRSLLASDKGLRLRVNRPVGGGAREAIVTFKGPRQRGPFKSREETEMVVDNPATAAALFRALGYAPILSFEKRRQTWLLDACKVELDELPFLGCFVEVEGPGNDAVAGVRKKLGLGDVPPVKGSYIGMLMTYLQEAGVKEREVLFPAEPVDAPRKRGG